jgi:hypothetical protein
MPNYVYTSIIGGKDTLKDNQNTTGAKFVAFMDKPTGAVSNAKRGFFKDNLDFWSKALYFLPCYMFLAGVVFFSLYILLNLKVLYHDLHNNFRYVRN